MPESVKMILTLTIISAVAAFSLAAVSDYTRPMIDKNAALATQRLIGQVLPDPATVDPNDPCKKVTAPGFDNDPSAETVCVDAPAGSPYAQKRYKVYRARKGGELIGVAVEAVGEGAYSGRFTTLVGVDPAGKVLGFQVLRHAETPGLGSKMEKCEDRPGTMKFVGRGPTDQRWKVKKDGGDIDALSGATITTRSAVMTVVKAQELVLKNRAAIEAATPMKGGEVCP